MSEISIADLSHTISELIDLDADGQSLVESAINRALSAKEVVGGISATIANCPVIAGGIMPAPDPTPISPSNPPPLINGLVINPHPTCPPDPFPIGRITKPTNCNPDYFPIGKIAKPPRGKKYS